MFHYTFFIRVCPHESRKRPLIFSCCSRQPVPTKNSIYVKDWNIEFNIPEIWCIFDNREHFLNQITFNKCNFDFLIANIYISASENFELDNDNIIPYNNFIEDYAKTLENLMTQYKEIYIQSTGGKYPIEGKILNINNKVVIEILFITKDCVTGNTGLTKEYYIPNKNLIIIFKLAIDLKNNENIKEMSTNYLTMFDIMVKDVVWF
jgi:hypothetical protein